MEKTKYEVQAERMYEAIYKAVLYIHQEFSTMVTLSYRASRAGKEHKDGIEMQLMRRWGITKYNNIYLQDEVEKDATTGNMVSLGPDAKSCDFTRCINSEGEVNEEKKNIFILKYGKQFEQEEARKQVREAERKATEGGADVSPDSGDGEHDSKRGKRPKPRGRGATAIADNQGSGPDDKGGDTTATGRVRKGKARAKGDAASKSG